MITLLFAGLVGALVGGSIVNNQTPGPVKYKQLHCQGVEPIANVQITTLPDVLVVEDLEDVIFIPHSKGIVCKATK